MGFLDDLSLLGRHAPEDAKNLLKTILGQMPITQLARGEADVSPNKLAEALRAMPVFDKGDTTGLQEGMNWMTPMLAAKIVYHGSPHKFDKFDASKIGTGEGAQAYGHGVYLADAENVAKEYAAANAGRAAAKSGFLDSLPPGVQVDVMKIMDQKHRGPLARAQLERVKDRLSTEQYEAVVREFDAGGALYKADLPDEWIPKMLDWDKPLSQQPENVRLLAQDLGLAKDATGKDVYSALSNQARDMGIIKGQPLQTTLPGSQEQATADLLGFGVPGIRYMDGGSRMTPTQEEAIRKALERATAKGDEGVAKSLRAQLENRTSNYVVFPGLEDKVKILERNGQPINVLAEMLK